MNPLDTHPRLAAHRAALALVSRRRAAQLGACTLALLATTPPAQAQAPFSFPREQTKLEINISAAEDVNPDDKGRPSPILVRLYELKSDGNFGSADYFSLYGEDKALLGTDLLVRDEFILRPGDTKAIKRKSHPDLAAIAVLAGYRDLAQSDWRAVHKVEPAPEAAWYRALVPANKLKLDIQLQAKGIRVTTPTD